MTARDYAPLLGLAAGGILTLLAACVGEVGGNGIPGSGGGEGSEDDTSGGGGDDLNCTTCPIGGGNEGGSDEGGAGGTGNVGGEGGGGGPPPPTGPQVCYPGANNDFTACVPVVDWSASWGSDYSYPSNNDPQYAKPIRFVDLSTAPSGLTIAPNFKLDEVMQEYKGRYGVFQPHVVSKLQEIRDIVGAALHTNSGYRSPAYNSSVGGVTYSRHMYGDAADMWTDGASVSQVKDICDQLGASYVGTYTSFTHCDWRKEPLEPAFYGAMDWQNVEQQNVELPVHTGTLTRLPNEGAWQAPATGFDEGEPLRIWTAYDAHNVVVGRGTGATFTPPQGATRLRVVVGGQVELETLLDGTR
ncbi:MAG: DUF882 domain-containing protein [Deltaproteobacteria bacterium]|nr:DUF882 domain-containing protein [Deltaproteobacteria bacterium]